MKAIAFNGSPRKDGNTAKMLKKALEGAHSAGAQTEFVHLRDLDMKSCSACFSCKIRGGKSYGKCVIKDDFTPFYRKIEEADAVILGSPIYFGQVSAETMAFMSRLFSYFVYGHPPSLYPGTAKFGFVYTMGVDAEGSKRYEYYIGGNERVMSRLFGACETLISLDTMHVEDYSKVVADNMVAALPRKLKHRQEEFPKDLQKAYELGARLVNGAK